jgi:hypothetical protein
MTEEAYTDRYRSEIKSNGQQVKAWIDSLSPVVDETMLCWEKAGQFCHRNLIAKMIEYYRPDCFGGSDVACQSVEVKTAIALPSSKKSRANVEDKPGEMEGDRALYEWFLSQAIESLPALPFQLDKGVSVVGIEFYKTLKWEARSSLDFLDGKRQHPSPRHYSEVLQSFIKRVRALQAKL